MKAFTDLPAEIRNQIYHEALSTGQTYDLRVRLDRSAACHALLSASRQVRKEALPIWRTGNHFEVVTNPDTPDGLHTLDLLRQRPPAGANHIQSLVLAFEMKHHNPATLVIAINHTTCVVKLFPWWQSATSPQAELQIRLLRKQAVEEAQFLVKEVERVLERSLDVHIYGPRIRGKSIWAILAA